jgi:hypothetical protein
VRGQGPEEPAQATHDGGDTLADQRRDAKRALGTGTANVFLDRREFGILVAESHLLLSLWKIFAPQYQVVMTL